MTAKLNELSNDFSSAGTKKYNAIKAEMDAEFKSLALFSEIRRIRTERYEYNDRP